MLSEGGMTAAQYVGVPDVPALVSVDAGIISLKSRTIPAAEAVAQSLRACDWLTDQGCKQIVFKICSTFDSTDEGNIGPVAEALADRLGETCVIVCPAFPENGRTVYQGHLFVADRLLSEEGEMGFVLHGALGNTGQWPVKRSSPESLDPVQTRAAIEQLLQDAAGSAAGCPASFKSAVT